MAERLTDEEMKAIRAFCDAGGPGPWRREQEEFINKGPRWLRSLLAEREQAPAAARPLPMPDGIFLHNAQRDPCDMAVGPCCCGAWHNAEETLCRLRESARAEVGRLRAALPQTADGVTAEERMADVVAAARSWIDSINDWDSPTPAEADLYTAVELYDEAAEAAARAAKENTDALAHGRTGL